MAQRTQTASPAAAPLYPGHFRMPSGYSSWRPRGSEDWLIIYTVSGLGYFTNKQGGVVARPGSVVLYSPGDWQDYRTAEGSEDWELLWSHFHPPQNWNRWLDWPLLDWGLRMVILEGEDDVGCREALIQTVDFSRRTSPVAVDLSMNSLERALLWCHAAIIKGAGVKADPRVTKAADYLSSHLSDGLELEQLARRCNLSVSRLSHLFKDELGVSPQQYLERQRMKHACQLLLLTRLSVEEVAREVGYADPFYFSNRFRKQLGVSPLKYRKGHGNGSWKGM